MMYGKMLILACGVIAVSGSGRSGRRKSLTERLFRSSKPNPLHLNLAGAMLGVNSKINEVNGKEATSYCMFPGCYDPSKGQYQSSPQDKNYFHACLPKHALHINKHGIPEQHNWPTLFEKNSYKYERAQDGKCWIRPVKDLVLTCMFPKCESRAKCTCKNKDKCENKTKCKNKATNDERRIGGAIYKGCAEHPLKKYSMNWSKIKKQYGLSKVMYKSKSLRNTGKQQARLHKSCFKRDAAGNYVLVAEIGEIVTVLDIRPPTVKVRMLDGSEKEIHESYLEPRDLYWTQILEGNNEKPIQVKRIRRKSTDRELADRMAEHRKNLGESSYEIKKSLGRDLSIIKRTKTFNNHLQGRKTVLKKREPRNRASCA